MLRLAVESGDVPAANDLAILLRDEGRLREALHLLVDAAAAGDQLAAANLVELQLEAGDLPAAAAAAEQYADRAQAGHHPRARRRARAAGPPRRRRRAVPAGGGARSAAGAHRVRAVPDRRPRRPGGAEREFREAERLAEPGWAFALGRFLLDDGRVDEARPYLQIAVDEGDPVALEALAELDGMEVDEY